MNEATSQRRRKVISRHSEGIQVTAGRLEPPGCRELSGQKVEFSRSHEMPERWNGVLDSAIAPIRSSPVAPFAKNERKRAFIAATYYTECFLHGIDPSIADNAAGDVQKHYEKWWKESVYHPTAESPEKKQRLDPSENLPLKPALPCLPASVTNEDESVVAATSDESFPIYHVPNNSQIDLATIERAKNQLITDLRNSGGDVVSPRFLRALDILHCSYASRKIDARWIAKDSCTYDLEGMWYTLSRPTFTECKGRNDDGQYVYSLGRLSFDMFRPTNLRCSIQGMFNKITDPRKHTESVSRPRSLPLRLLNDKFAKAGSTRMRNYDIVIAFTIEEKQTRHGVVRKDEKISDEYITRRPIRGLLTNHGYCLPDPEVPNRISIWFSGGSIEVQDDDADLTEWKEIFDSQKAPRRDVKELASILAARVMLGAHIPDQMSDDGTLSYSLTRPIGGHGQVFCDVIYADEALRVMKGHNDTLFVFSRVPEDT